MKNATQLRPIHLESSPADDGLEMERLVRRELELLGEDPDREGLLKTPERIAKSLTWLTRGYDMDIADIVGDAVFAERQENMVMVRDIEMYSLCEHHMLRFLDTHILPTYPMAESWAFRSSPGSSTCLRGGYRFRSGSRRRLPKPSATY